MPVTQHAESTYQEMKRNLLAHVRSIFPIAGRVHRLELKSLEIQDNLNPEDYKSQKQSRMTGRTWSVPMVATFELKNQSGKVINRAKMKIIDVPRLTNRGSYIVGGSEYMFPAQKRLRSGPYVRVGQNDELRTFFNMAKGRNFHLGIHPAKGHFQFQIDTSKNIPLYPLLRALGVTDEQMIRAWGREAFIQNRVDDPAVRTKALKTIFEKMSYGTKPPATDLLESSLRKIFESTQMDSANTELTIGKRLGSANGEALLLASAKMLRVGRGEEKEDNRDSLIHNDIVDLSDFVVERFKDPQFRGRIQRTIKFNLDRRDKVNQIVSRDSFQRPINSLFTESQLSQSPTQTNPLGMISDYTAVTVRGEGGIQQSNALTKGLRALDPSHMGFLDPAHTPEGQQVGTVLHMTTATRKRGRDLVTRLLDVRTGKEVEKTPVEVWNSVVAFHESLDGKRLKRGRVKATHMGEIANVPSSRVDYAFLTPQHLLDVNTSNVPFVSHNNGARVMMASKLSIQAKPLVDGDVPLVQAQVPTEKGTVDRAVGEAFSPKSPIDGVVEKVGDEEIVVSGQRVPIPHYFPLNSNNFVHARPTVKVGQRVKKDQVLADTNYTKDGQTAMGKNLLVAYTPYKGMNVEDGVVISRQAAAKMTSEHLYQQPYAFDADTIMDLKQFRSYFPAKITEEQARGLDERGVVKKGQILKPGDPMVVSMRRQRLGTESQRMARISKILGKEFRDDSMVWDKDVEGVVQEVGWRPKGVVIHVRTKEPMKIGDKIVGRHGNKGIVTCFSSDSEILTDSGWKLFKDLSTDDKVCTLNPHSREIQYNRPERIIDEPYQGKMWQYEGRRLNLCVTPTHRHFVRTRRGDYRFETAEEVAGKPRIHLRTGCWVGESNETITIPGRPDALNLHKKFCEPRDYDANDFLEFFGYWITEGSLSRKNQINLAQSREKNPETYFSMKRCLERLGYQVYDGENVLYVFDPRLNHWLQQFGKATEKFIPREFLKMCPEQLRVMADAIFEGGVYYREKDNHARFELFTSSKRLADDYQELALKLGMSANIKPQNRKNRNTEYVVRWSMKKEVWVNNDKRYDNESWVDYNGRVYCVEVPNNLIYVRRNGIPVWSGNSILDDEEMPKDEKGRTLDLLLNPNGVVSRMNLGQILETTASRVAEKTGKPFVAQGFGGDSAKEIATALKKNGLKDHETIYDPVENEKIPGILVGRQHIYKLEHQATKKMSARGAGVDEEYTADEQPTHGKRGGRAIGSMELYALLAHGSLANIDEMYNVKGGFDPEIWRAIENGAPLPPRRPSFSQQRFESMLKGMGIRLEHERDKVTMVPFLDRDLKKITAGEISDHKLLRAKDLREEKNGLFDTKKTGGLRGDRWSHIKLPEPIPNPTFEKAILSLLHMKKAEFDEIMAGKKKVNGKTGGAAIKSMLDEINVSKRLAEAQKQVVGKSGAELNALWREIRFLKTLKARGIKPGEYVISYLPVLPPKFRPVYQMPDGNLNVSDVNFHYQSTIQLAQQLKDMKGKEFEDQRKKLTNQIYKSVGGVMGLNDGVVERSTPPSGLARIISGRGSPKGGYLHKRVLKKRQDVSATNVIVANPELGMDEVGLPEATAWKTFRPFLVKELRTMGMTPLQARKAIDDKTPMAKKALEKVVKERHVILNRAPTLHKFSVMAFKPKLVSGYALEIPPLIVGGFNADFNGDSCKPSESLIFSVDGEIACTTFDEMVKEIVVPGATDESLMEMAKGATAILELRDGFNVLSWIPGSGIMWRPASQLTIHTSHGPAFEVKTHIGRKCIVSEHHNFSIVDQDLIWKRVKTEKLDVGSLVPFARKIDVQNTVDKINVAPGWNVTCNFESGWFFGYFAGNGSITGRGETISLACGDDNLHPLLADSFASVGLSSWDEKGKSVRCSDHKSAAEALKSLFGHGAPNKKIPGFVFQANEEFRRGFVSGFLDAESNVYEDVNGSPHVRVEVTSSKLVDGFCWLLSTIGIGAYVRDGKKATARTHKTHVLEISRADLADLPLPRFESKSQLLCQMIDDNYVRGRYDLVPFSSKLADVLLSMGRKSGSKKMSTGTAKNYRSKEIRHFGDRGYLTRAAAQRIINKYGHIDNDLYRLWRSYVDDTTTGWTLIKSVEEVERPPIMYDFSVPKGNETFAVSGGMITHNTMGIHVPISAEANAEAAKMLPSKHLYKPGTGKLQQKIDHEYVLGLFKISRPSTFSTKRYQGIGQVLSDLRARKIRPDVGISVTGIGATTPGRVLINEALPQKLRDYSTIWTNKAIQEKLKQVDKVAGRQAFVRALQEWANIGRRYAFSMGSSFLLSDLQTMNKQRNAAFRRADKIADRIRMGGGSEEEKKKRIVQLYTGISRGLEKRMDLKSNAAGKSNNIMDMMQAGARGNPGQIRQMVSNVGVMLNHENQPMPEPVRGTYTEGLQSAEFFQHMYGNRKSMIDKSQSVKDPGALTKQVIVSAAGFRVSSPDCGTTNGIQASTSGTEAMDRYMAESISGVGGTGTVVTSSVLAAARAKGLKTIKVRSPMTCRAAVGVCARCYGLNEEGKLPPIGDHVGIKDSQGITEPSTQLAMRTFHTGGVVVGKKDLTTGFDRVKQLFTMPDAVHAKATLAEISGRVDAIRERPQGGSLVTIAGRVHRVTRGRKVEVKVGDMVERGQKITDGDVQPQDVLRLKGLRSLQKQLRDDIHAIYAAAGEQISHKTIETPVRMLTETVRISDPGDHPSLIAGDYSTYGRVDSWNRENKGKRPVRYTHQLPGSEYLPHRSDDWAKRMAHNRIQQVLQEAPAMGAVAPMQGGSPFAALISGQRIKQDPWKQGGLTHG